MEIYTKEKSIAHLIESDTKISSTIIDITLKDDISNSAIEKFKDIVDNEKAKAALSEPHPDLMYGSAILVSTVVNKNDDVFLPEETWKARNTPINTPYNDQHVETDIIGHIIDSRVLDKDKNVISDESESLPDYFDIEVDFVIYKSIFPDIAEEISIEAPKGKKFVSMEARYHNFGYGIFTNDGELSIIDRNEETAFLTKYLRAFGGSGKFDGKKIVRVLRDFVFVGMGNVDTPANPASEYTKLENTNFIKCSGISDIEKEFLYLTKGKIMTIENLEQAKEIIATLTKEKDDQKTELDTVKANLDTVTKEKSDLSDKVNEIETKLTVAEKAIEDAKTGSTQLSEEVKALKASLKDSEDAKAELKTKLDKIEAEAKLEDRLTKLKEVGIDADDETKAKLSNMTDEVFASILEFGNKIKVTKTEQTEGTKTEAEETLENVEENVEADVTQTEGDTATQEETRMEVAKKLVAAIETYRNRKSTQNKEKK